MRKEMRGNILKKIYDVPCMKYETRDGKVQKVKSDGQHEDLRDDHYDRRYRHISPIQIEAVQKSQVCRTVEHEQRSS
jgi:hypothetical protein